jgi:hypothetical protein
MAEKKFTKDKFPFSWYSGWGGYQMRVDSTSGITQIGQILGKYLSTSHLNKIFSRIEHWSGEISRLLRNPELGKTAAEETKKIFKKQFGRGKKE